MYISHAKGRASTNLPGLTLRPHWERLLERDFFAWVSSLSTQAEVGARGGRSRLIMQKRHRAEFVKFGKMAARFDQHF